MQFKNLLVWIQLSIHNRNAPLGRDAAIQVISLSMTLSSLRQDFIQRRFRRRLGLLCLHLAPATVGLAMMFLEHCLQDVLSLILGRFLPLLMCGLHLFQPSSSMLVKHLLFCHWFGTHLNQFGIDLFQGRILMVQVILQSLNLQLCLMKVLFGKLELNVLQLHCCLQLCLAAAGSKKP